jgi:hypothetical protein
MQLCLRDNRAKFFVVPPGLLSLPPVGPKGDFGISELFGEYGANSVDELIDIVKDHPGTYPSGS